MPTAGTVQVNVVELSCLQVEGATWTLASLLLFASRWPVPPAPSTAQVAAARPRPTPAAAPPAQRRRGPPTHPSSRTRRAAHYRLPDPVHRPLRLRPQPRL